MTALRESRCLNPHPEQVTDEAFLAVEAERRADGTAASAARGAPWSPEARGEEAAQPGLTSFVRPGG